MIIMILCGLIKLILLCGYTIYETEYLCHAIVFFFLNVANGTQYI